MNIPDEVQDALDAAMEGEEFVDNIRVAREDSPEQMGKYAQQQSEGCCGFFDAEMMVDGVVWYYGFNYGH